MTTCSGHNPNADLFICVDGGWVPRDHPTAAHAPAPPSTHDFMPPTADEFTDGIMTRTADPTQWFVDGQRYVHPYEYMVRVEGIALRKLDGVWRWCHRLVIIETSGDPGVGHVLYARLFAPRHTWEVVQE